MKNKKQITDIDLPLAYRTQANLWKSKYFEAYKELVKANKGLRRLKYKTNYLENKLKQITPKMDMRINKPMESGNDLSCQHKNRYSDTSGWHCPDCGAFESVNLRP